MGKNCFEASGIVENMFDRMAEEDFSRCSYKEAKQIKEELEAKPRTIDVGGFWAALFEADFKEEIEKQARNKNG